MHLSYSVEDGYYGMKRYSELCKDKEAPTFPLTTYCTARSSLLQLKDATIFKDGELMEFEGVPVRRTYFR